MNTNMYNEPIDYQNNLLHLKIWEIVKTYTHQAWNKRWHYHQELELLYIQDGFIEVRIQDEFYTLGTGDVLLIGSNQPHVTRKVDENPLTYLVLHFDMKAFLDATMLTYYRFFNEIDYSFSKLNHFIYANPHIKQHIAQNINSIYQEMETKTRGYEMSVRIKVNEILLSMLRVAPEYAVWETERHNVSALHEVIDYINQHLAENIEMKQVSSLVNMNYYYFSKYFKKMIGLSFKEYVNLQRIKKAERLLLTEDVNVNLIAEQVGITNMAHFYKLFRRFNQCSPKQYIKKMTSNSDSPKSLD